MNYAFWNTFVNNWMTLPLAVYGSTTPIAPFNRICGWTNPNLQPLMNSIAVGDYSLKYIPEPWWGNNGIHELNSVVINYNPGGGKGMQLHNDPGFPLTKFHDYSSFADSEACRKTNNFAGTNRWHNGKRAARVFNTLDRIGYPLHGGNDLQNHLSIELIPWHTANTLTIASYISINLQEIFKNCLLFAADQSKRINNSKLRNKVILRLSGDTTMHLLNSMVTSGYGHYNIITPISYTGIGAPPPIINGKGGYMKFYFNVVPDVEFISIWGTGRTGNDFPPDADMNWIFTHII